MPASASSPTPFTESDSASTFEERRPAPEPATRPRTTGGSDDVVLLSLSHAARLVGVAEGDLKDAVRERRVRVTRMVLGGNLTPMIRVSDLQLLYPHAPLGVGSHAGLPEEEEIAGQRSSAVSALPVARSHAVEVHDLVARAVEERVLQVARLERELGYARARSRFGILAAASAGLLVGIGLLAFERGRSLGQAERAVSMASQITRQSETLRAELAGLRVTMEESERRHARTRAELSASTAALGQDIERNRRFAELRGRRAPTWPYTQTLDPAD
jgi:hypothetical protein